MLRTTGLLVGAITTLGSFAQVWCPPGAEWNCSTIGLGMWGYVGRTYEADTLFEGLNAQRIHETGITVLEWTQPEPDTIWIDAYHYTAIVDSTLLLWGSVVEPTGWDTLIRFNAQIGDRWYPPGTDALCDAGMGQLMLTDTGHVVLDGMTLRTWMMEYCDPDGTPAGIASVFTERLGYDTGLFLPMTCIIFEYSEHLSCYSDNEIGYNDALSPFGCASLTGMAERGANERITPFPNPGTGSFTLQLPGGLHTISVFDATGRMVLSEGTACTNVQIHTGQLPPGLYGVVVADANGPVSSSRWVKE